MDFDTRDIKEFIKDISKYLIVGIFILVLFIYVVSFQQVIGPSMTPNYEEGEVFLLNKLNYKLFDVKRFDVIVLNSAQSKYMIKRVIGLPNEHIKYESNKLYVNGKLVDEDFDKNGDTEDFDITVFDYVIPEGQYFVVGDNRVNSQDSRKFGFIKEEDIVGKVGFRIWPIFKK